MHNFSLLIKPVADSCNLNCHYCFYKGKTPFSHVDGAIMSDETLRRTIRSYLATRQPQYIFTWQGGEPLLLGYDFFARAVELQKQYCREGAVIANGLQTNGTLLDNKLCTLFNEYSFLVGVSLDGPQDVHDTHRLTSNGKPSHHKVWRGIELMQEHVVEFNIMTLVSKANVHRARELYYYFKERGLFYQQYIPCVEVDSSGNLMPYSITGKEWGTFLGQIFDEWYPSDTRTISIRNFDTIVTRMFSGSVDTCTIDDNCSHYCVVEHNGDIYPCDFFVRKDFKTGNIHDNGWSEIFHSPIFHTFSQQKANWSDQCSSCRFLPLCGGDCTRNRTIIQKCGRRLSCLCDGLRMFFNKTDKKFRCLVNELMQEFPHL